MPETKQSEPRGGHPPGGSFESPHWHFEMWPNRSLSRKGLRWFLTLLAGCFLFFILMTATAPGSAATPQGLVKVLLVIVGFIIIAFACLVWAFAANNRDGRYKERIGFSGDRLVVEAEHPSRPLRRWEFQPYWTDVITRTTKRIDNQLILRQRDCAVAIGSFLTPEERADLAEEIKTALLRFNSAPFNSP